MSTTAARKKPTSSSLSTQFILLLCLVLVVVFVLLLASPSSPHPHGHHPNRRLKLHFTNTSSKSNSHSIPFDPVIADLERGFEDKEWEREHYRVIHDGDNYRLPQDEQMREWEEYMRAEDYINDEDRFNVTARIIDLFPKIDTAPADGVVTLHELTSWNLLMAKKEQMHNSERDMRIFDKDGDGLISFADFQDHKSDTDFVENFIGLEWEKEEHFNASDFDGDGFLNKEEFNDFLHPLESENPKTVSLLSKQELRKRDIDGDGKLDFREYLNGIHSNLHSYDDENRSFSDHTNTTYSRELFDQLDKDNNGFLSEHELEPVLDKIYVSERFHARQAANHAFSEADTNKDGHLTLNEMIENPYAFYDSVFSMDEDEYFHDEFR